MSTPTTIQGAPPTLPPNVLIFSPTDSKASKALLNGRIFTKLATTTRTTPSQLISALSKITPTAGENTENFCLAFRKGILIFDGHTGDETSQSPEDLTDAHHEHFRQVCLALRDSDINLDFSACIFDVSDVLAAGFQLDEMSQGAVLVIDLMDRGDEDEGDSDDDSDEDDEATEASLRALVSGNIVEAQ
jgi:hypothetical protein